MSMRYPGGLIASTPVNANYPSGVWTQAQTNVYNAQNVWQRDQYWPYTTLLLHGDGTNGAQNNTFLDSSTNNFTITRNGNTTQGAFTPYDPNGYWSNYFNGSSSITAGSNTAFAFGTGSFTVEAWVNPSTTALQCIFDNRGSDATAAGFFFGLFGSNQLGIYTNATTTNGGTVPVGVWSHVAVVRSGSTWTIYLNGNSVATYTSSANLTDGNSQIGASTSVTSSSANYMTGYISNVRVLKGTALYTAAFTPPTAPLTAITNTSLLTCQSNRFIDNSTNAFAITVNGSPSVQAFQPFPGATTWSASVLGGSGYFDGSGDFLALPDNAALEPGSSNLTWEMWINTTNSTQYATLYSRTPSTFASGMWSLMMNWASSTAGDIAVYFGDFSVTGPLMSTTGVSVRDGAWHHIAVVKNGSAWAIYVDGVSRATATWAGTIADIAFGPYVGRDQNYIRDYTGYMTDLRVLKGTALYTTAFTPPTVPLTAITNTSLLLSFTNAGIFDNAQMNNMETVGNAQISTSVVKYGTGSMYFDGVGDYLVTVNKATVRIAGDYTVECWFNAPSLTGAPVLVSIGDWNTGQNGLDLYIEPATKKINLYSNGTTIIASPSNAVVVGQWMHCALVRSGTGSNNTTLYINGISVGQATNTTVFVGTTANGISVGADQSGGSWGDYFTGYIDDVRITNGVARYIGNFTPPIARMPNQ